MADIDLHELGARVLSVCGPFGSKTIVVMPTEIAQQMFPDGLAVSGMPDAVDGLERDLAALAEVAPTLAEGGLAGSARTMAWEMVNPYTSATAKSMCAGRLQDALARLREMAPPEEKKGTLHAIRAERSDRLSEGRAGA